MELVSANRHVKNLLMLQVLVLFLVHIWPGNYIVHRVPLRIKILNSSSEWEITVL